MPGVLCSHNPVTIHDPGRCRRDDTSGAPGRVRITSKFDITESTCSTASPRRSNSGKFHPHRKAYHACYLIRCEMDRNVG